MSYSHHGIPKMAALILGKLHFLRSHELLCLLHVNRLNRFSECEGSLRPFELRDAAHLNPQTVMTRVWEESSDVLWFPS